MKNKLLLSLLAMTTLIVSSCDQVPTEQPTEQPNSEVSESATVEPTTEEPTSEVPTTEEPTTEEPTTEEPTTEEPTTEEPTTDEPEFRTITIAEAIEIAMQAGETVTSESYIIHAKIDSILNPTYGEMNIKDETGTLYVYGLYTEDGTRYDAFADKPVAGDDIVLKGKLKTYKGTPEMDRGYLIDFTHNNPAEDLDLTQYTETSIAQARKLEEDSKVIVDGVVAHITHAFGFVPNGFYLVDETSSIYVYDTQLAAQLSIGNKVKIAATKDFYVLETEQESADKFGYQGCNQLTNSVLLENDKANNNFDTSWIEETTVMDIVNTPVTEDITTLVYKVNSYIKKVPGSNFTNYYLYDLDGTTGSYVYTQCNGSDFSYLDEFDGKVCTVYITAHNAKSTKSDCFFRFLPILVKDEGYKFDTAKAGEFALKYYVNNQFKDTYLADPALDVVTNVSNDIVGIEGVQVSYTSNNESSVYFEVVDGKTIMHTKEEGVAEVTVKATYNGVEASNVIKINVGEQVSVVGVSVIEAINAQKGEEVQVQGVVAASLVNQSGFYLIDETGVISVRCDSAVLEDVHQGDFVVVKGTRDNIVKAGNNNIGQSTIDKASIVANYYGNHEYSKDSFDSSYTIDELYGFSIDTDYTTQVYVVEGIIQVIDYGYYKNVLISDVNGKNQLRLYAGSAEQYSFAFDYTDQVVTMEICLCNWNSSKYYTGCLLSITTSDGTVVYNELNLAK